MTSRATSACGRGMVFSVNAPSGEHNNFKLRAISAEGRDLRLNAIVAEPAVQQIASTVSVNVAGVAAAAAPSGAPLGGPPQVIAGQGQTGAGQQCGCSCLCGQGAVPPGAALGSFGGIAGEMPMPQSPAGLSQAGAMGPAGQGIVV